MVPSPWKNASLLSTPQPTHTWSLPHQITSISLLFKGIFSSLHWDPCSYLDKNVHKGREGRLLELQLGCMRRVSSSGFVLRYIIQVLDHWLQLQSRSWRHFVFPTGMWWVLSDAVPHPIEQYPSLPPSPIPCFWFLPGLNRETRWQSEGSRMMAIRVVKWKSPGGSHQAAESSQGDDDVSPVTSRCQSELLEGGLHFCRGYWKHYYHCWPLGTFLHQFDSIFPPWCRLWCDGLRHIGPMATTTRAPWNSKAA